MRGRKEFGAHLVSTSWLIDIVEENKKYILTIEAKTGTTQMRFSLEEIERTPKEKTRK
jgi:Holliday junction resolvase-like predicted endonuclease